MPMKSPTIKRLPEIIANKIAAGEVVERPASVVKELLENAIDAKSTRIRIDLEKGGTQLIRLSDNGIGMNRDNAILSLERHATSKIVTDDDLFSIQTLGFRGEALPSIAAISKMVMVTRPQDTDIATEIHITGGKIIQVNDAGAPSGTYITVKDIFYNTPARKKYLKSIRTELSHIIDYLTNISVGFPSIHFKLFHNGRSIKNWPQTKNASDRIAEVLGDDLYKKLYPIEFKNDDVVIEGYIASPEKTRKTSSHVIFVNGRVVSDRLIQHAIFEGYRGRLLKGSYPVAVLFLSVPFDDVDVNVHPAKQTVRFANQGSIHQAIVQAIQKGLSQSTRAAWNPIQTEKKGGGEKNQPPPKTLINEVPDNQPFVKENPASSHGLNQEHGVQSDPQEIYKTHASLTDPSNQVREKMDPGHFSSRQKDLISTPHEVDSPQKNEYQYASFKILGQLKKTYIICEKDEAMFLIDQHAAHERIVYERLKDAVCSRKIPVQRLLIPETIELTYQQTSAFSEMLPELHKVGLEIANFGQNTFIVQSVPDILSGKDIKLLIQEMAQSIPEIKNTAPMDQAIDDCLMRMACHSAIRSGKTLTITEIQELLKSLDQCKNPSQCPHGRPTCIQWDLMDIEKKFKRMG